MTGGLVTLGETMALIRSASFGSLETQSDLRLSVGGAESNVAIGVTRLGGSVSWIGRVGADSLGRRVIRELRAEGVDTHVTVDEQRPTGLMVKETLHPAATRVMYYRSASAGSALAPDDVPLAAIAGAAVLHVTGITLALSASAAAAVEYAVDAAVAAGVDVSFDVNHRATLWRDTNPAAQYRRIAERATIIFASREEASLLVPSASTPNELALGLAELGAAQVVVKLGDQGCVAAVDGTQYRQDAHRVAVVDTVGAGDAFVAGYLAELMAGAQVAVRLATAVAAGALVCLNPGDWEGSARRQDLAAFDAIDPVAR